MRCLKRVGIALVLSATLLVGCSPAVTSGVVVDKSHSNGYMLNCGKSCLMWVPPKWNILVEGLTEEGVPDTQWLGLTEKEWKTYIVGDDYPHEIGD